jgi:hypothetical protein
LSILASVAREASLDNKVGYGKKLDFPADKVCFNAVLEELKAHTPCKLSVTYGKQNGKITNYELTIDGKALNEEQDMLTPASSQLSKEFLRNVQQRCTN